MARTDETQTTGETVKAETARTAPPVVTPAPATTAAPAGTPAARTEQLREEIAGHVLLAPVYPCTELVIPDVGDGEPIVLRAEGTPVDPALREEIEARAALAHTQVVEITA